MRRAAGLTRAVRSALTGALTVCAVVGAAGCAPLMGGTPGSTTPSGVAHARSSHEYPAQAAPARQAVPAREDVRAPVEAVRAFATAYINWTAATVTAQLQALAALSVGQARAAMTLAASETARDYELRRGGVANSGTVEAVAPLSGRPDQYVVVTRELTSASATDAYRGLGPAWHVALATVTRIGATGWALSGWQPEN